MAHRLFLATGFTLLSSFFIHLSPGTAAGACGPLPTDKGLVTSTVTIPASGSYRVWSRIYAPDNSNNSYYLQIDDTYCSLVVGDAVIPANAYTWVDYQAGNSSNKITVSLSAGTHTVKMAGREAGVRLDKIQFLSDTSCTPSGVGDNCTTTSTTSPSQPTPNPPPSSSATTVPNNPTATKTEYFINGQKLEGNTLDTVNLPDGEYEIETITYNQDGSVNSEKNRMLVNNDSPGSPVFDPVSNKLPHVLGIVILILVAAAAITMIRYPKIAAEKVASVIRIINRKNSTSDESARQKVIVIKPTDNEG